MNSSICRTKAAWSLLVLFMGWATIEAGRKNKTTPSRVTYGDAATSQDATPAMQKTEDRAPKAPTPLKSVSSSSEIVYDMNMPTIIYFTSKTCQPCKLMTPRLEKFLRKHKNKVHAFKVDTDDSDVQDLVNAFHVTNVPDVKVIKTSLGSLPEDMVDLVLSEALGFQSREQTTTHVITKDEEQYDEPPVKKAGKPKKAADNERPIKKPGKSKEITSDDQDIEQTQTLDAAMPIDDAITVSPEELWPTDTVEQTMTSETTNDIIP